MKFIADFHIHSKYSRATSKDMDIEHLSEYAKLKGIKLLGTGDFTHHLWLEELKDKLEPKGNGLFEHNGIKFVLTTEVCNIFYRGEKCYRVHNMIFAPSFGVVDEINSNLAAYGNLAADGRPMLSLDSKNLVKIVVGISKDCLIVPGHIWTPWFSLFGSNSGFDKIEDCFEEQTKNIYALETGLSSDPAMNWRWSALDRYSLISNSDSHSPSKIGREANIFDCELTYDEVIGAIRNKDKDKFLYTIEFFPQEGKYHWDGHRVCNVSLAPRDAISGKNKCPVCGKEVTIGVMHRVEELCDRKEGFMPQGAIPFKRLIPLDEIIADSKGLKTNSVAVEKEYMMLIQRLGNELSILLDLSESDLLKSMSPKIVQGILKVREGKVNIEPGYDGVYGKIKIFGEENGKKEEQMKFF